MLQSARNRATTRPRASASGLAGRLLVAFSLAALLVYGATLEEPQPPQQHLDPDLASTFAGTVPPPPGRRFLVDLTLPSLRGGACRKDTAELLLALFAFW